MSDESKPSLADRITKPLNAASTSFSPSAAGAAPAQDSNSWADEVASPPATKGDEGSLANTQLDGATETDGGSSLHDTQYDVEVKLSDIQGDVNSPLHSISSFEEIGM